VGREASIFACLTDAVVAPAGPLPAVRETDAVAAFGRYLQRSPAINRAGLRGMLFALELGSLAFGYGRRMRALSPATRQAYLTRLDSSALSFGLTVLRSLAHVSYYGDEGVMRLLGYDATANVARGRAVRRAEARW
jgi:hypothetical protein